MGESTVFDFWLAENAMNYQWQLNRLRAEGIDGRLENGYVTFYTEAETQLATFLKGKTFNVLTWKETEVRGVVLDNLPLTTPEPTPTPVVEPEVVVAPVEPTPTPEPEVVAPVIEEVKDTPAPKKKTRRPSPTHVDDAVTPTVEDTSNATSPAVPAQPEGESAPAAT